MNKLINNKYLLLLCIFTLLSVVLFTIPNIVRRDHNTSNANQITINNKQDAIQFLKQKLQGHKKNIYWLTSNCVTYWTESTNAAWMVELHELHNKDCWGDPNTMPLLARFTINKKTQEIVWYDIRNDQYKPLNEFLLVGD